MAELIATCSVEQKEPVSDRVHIFPFGVNILGRNGAGPYTLRDKSHAAQVIRATQSFQRGADLPLDYEHQTQLDRSHNPKPAAGWIKADSLTIFPNGIWGKVEWTARASQHLAGKEYRYFSPTFHHDTKGSVIRLVGGALTHLPNLELTALASQGATMNTDTLASAKALMGLKDADDAAFLTSMGTVSQFFTALATKMGLSPETGPAGVLVALKAKGGEAATASQDGEHGTPGNMVPVEMLLAVASQADEYRRKLSSSDVETMVEKAMNAGKLTPAMRDWAVATASQNTGMFTEFVDKMPPVFSGLFKSDFEGRPFSPVPDDKSGGLSPSQLALCSQMNITPDEFIKTQKG